MDSERNMKQSLIHGLQEVLQTSRLLVYKIKIYRLFTFCIKFICHKQYNSKSAQHIVWLEGKACHSNNNNNINESAVEFLNTLGHRIAAISSDDKEGQFLFQRLSIALQRFTAILLHESFVSDADPDL